jgi:regulator of cell morphogenesis and NO signaling
MQTLDINRTVSEMLRERPARSRVFEKFRIDYCCGGKLPLKDACEKREVAVETVLEELLASDAAASADDGLDFATMPLNELADHIVSTHHAYLAEELPRLAAMASRVAKVHGDSDERLVELDRVLEALIMELQAHMSKEEQILFPVISLMAETNTMHNARFGTIANPIRMMEHEHDDAGNGLERMRDLTDGFTPPDWACGTYRALLDGLATLEKDMHQHVHKENNILFPRALELEEGLLGAQA